MDESLDYAQDEELVLLVHKHNVPSYYELFDRCKEYSYIPASELQQTYRTVTYDEQELMQAITTAFNASVETYDFKSSFFKNFFINIFRHDYTKLIKERSERENKEYSLDEYLSPYTEKKYEDILSDGRDYYQEFYDIVSRFELLSSLKTKLALSPKAKAIVLYRYHGYSFKEISKIMKLSVKQIRHILENPKLKYMIKQLVDELIEVYHIPVLYR